MSNALNQAFYQKSVEEFGVSAQGVHWNSKYTQYKRFEVITKFIRKSIKQSTVVDAGCGFGEYYKYLHLNHQLPLQYTGIDCEQEMIIIARKRFENIDFFILDILKNELYPADYYVCSGAMNILRKQDVWNFIRKCFEISKKGFIFNLLKKDSFNNLNIDDVVNFCHTLSNVVKIKDNYLDNDITIFIDKRVIN